jgi:hypothetical protein
MHRTSRECERAVFRGDRSVTIETLSAFGNHSLTVAAREVDHSLTVVAREVDHSLTVVAREVNHSLTVVAR